MNKFIMAILVVSLVAVGRNLAEKSAGGYAKELDAGIQSVVSIENEVIVGNTLPRRGTVCSDTNVYGQPADSSAPLYTLKSGDAVQLREQSRGNGRSWVMIAPANWIRLIDLCAR